MRRILLTALMAGVASSALAADLPTHKAPPAPAPYYAPPAFYAQQPRPYAPASNPAPWGYGRTPSPYGAPSPRGSAPAHGYYTPSPRYYGAYGGHSSNHSSNSGYRRR